jgi:hypothetical protein
MKELYKAEICGHKKINCERSKLHDEYTFLLLDCGRAFQKSRIDF